MLKLSVAVVILAVISFGVAGCGTQNWSTEEQAGTALGAAGGAVAGYNVAGKGKRWEGAAIGALAGGTLGHIVGHEVGKVKFCPQCGRQYQRNENYCKFDGTELQWKQ